MAYATLAELKTILKITDAADDGLLQDYLDAAQAAFEAATDRVFEAAADATRYYDPRDDVDGGTLWLDADLCAVTTVTSGGTDVTAGVVTVPRNATPYYGLKLKSGYSWQCGDECEDAIAVTGKWAYSATPPADVKQAVLRLAAWMYHARTNPEGDRNVVTPSGVVLQASSWPSDVREIAARYRRAL